MGGSVQVGMLASLPFLPYVRLFAFFSASPFARASEEAGDVAAGTEVPKIEEPIGSVPAGSTTDTQTQER